MVSAHTIGVFVMQLHQIDHVSLIITSVPAARHFYGTILGLQEIPAPKEFDFVAIWFDLGSCYLHLLLKDQPDTISPRHVCFETTDITKARAKAMAHGLKIDETVKIVAADRFFLRDPDGNRIEILQWNRRYRPHSDGLFSA
jgi:catechol 2,3-dioxygenase-like lactoylglutathione lyase family enzyme